MVRIFIVEDHPVVRKGYISFFSREPEIVISGEAESAQEALAKLPQAKTDVVVLDVSLPGEMNGIDLLREIRRRFPEMTVLVVSGNEEAVYGDLVKQLGAWGYVMKGNVDALMKAMRAVVDHVQHHERKADA